MLTDLGRGMAAPQAVPPQPYLATEAGAALATETGRPLIEE
jgi:hypothetical protein